MPNPWQVLAPDAPRTRGQDEASIPVVLDQTTANYALDLWGGRGETFTIQDAHDRRLDLQVAGLLKDSIFQGDLLLGEGDLQRYDPDAAGYRYFLIETPPGKATAVQQALQQKLGDYGFVSETTVERLSTLAAVAEHVSCHVPESRRAGALVGHDRAGRRAMAERLGAAGRVGPAPRRRFPRADLGHPRGDGERAAAGARARGRALGRAWWPSCRTSSAAAPPCPLAQLAAIFALVLVAGLAASLAGHARRASHADSFGPARRKVALWSAVIHYRFAAERLFYFFPVPFSYGLTSFRR